MSKTKLSESVKYLIIVLALILFDNPNGVPINPPIKDIPIMVPHRVSWYHVKKNFQSLELLNYWL